MSYAYGIYSGTTDIYYALMTTADTSTTAPVYGTPVLLGHSVSFTVTPTYKEGSKYASNHAVRRFNKVNTYEVTISSDGISPSKLAAVLGRTIGTDGVQVIKGEDVPPYIALGFGITKDNGDVELWWMYKGTLKQNEISGETETEDISYRDIELSGVFDRRMNDDAIAAVADTSVATTVTESTWFASVYAASAD